MNDLGTINDIVRRREALLRARAELTKRRLVALEFTSGGTAPYRWKDDRSANSRLFDDIPVGTAFDVLHAAVLSWFDARIVECDVNLKSLGVEVES